MNAQKGTTTVDKIPRVSIITDHSPVHATSDILMFPMYAQVSTRFTYSICTKTIVNED